MTELWLDPISRDLQALAREALAKSDALGFLCLRNTAALKKAGIYEVALVLALTGARSNNAHIDVAILQRMLDLADRERLRKAGDPLPAVDEFELFWGRCGARAESACSGTLVDQRP